MTSRTWRSVNDNDRLFREVVRSEPGKVLIAMDFDGTLAPMVPNPDDSRMHPPSADALKSLGRRLGKLAIITGRGAETVRRLGELDSREGFERATVLGQYGVERWDAETGNLRIPETPPEVQAARRDLVAMLAKLAGEGKQVAGVHLEDKGRAIGVHTRRADHPEAAMEAVDEPTRRIADKHGLHFEPGRSVLELRSSKLTKADALREIGSELRPTAVAMLGDDLGDVPAFELLAELRSKGLVCCAVVSASDEQPALVEHADVICDGPDGIADWLASLL